MRKKNDRLYDSITLARIGTMQEHDAMIGSVIDLACVFMDYPNSFQCVILETIRLARSIDLPNQGKAALLPQQ